MRLQEGVRGRPNDGDEGEGEEPRRDGEGTVYPQLKARREAATTTMRL